ncbi:MAG: sigma-54 interaction domain-containing protein [Verrucomicrobiia bacterium]
MTSDQSVLRLIVEGTVAETGKGFFRALVRNLACALGTSGAWVTEYFPKERRLRALAMWLNGEFIEDYEYCIDGTPCAPVVEDRKLIHIPENVVALYPGDNDLRPMNAVSYLGAPLLDVDGTVMGHLSVLDAKPLPREPRIVSLFEVFAARAAAEHRRLKAEEAVRAREEQLSQLLHNALDAILILNDQMQIDQVNPAAERLFDCTEEDLTGELMSSFLAPESAARLQAFGAEISARPAGRQQLWVPQDLVARRWDHSVFPAEATLSRFEARNQVFYTLILRNTDERAAAERQIQLLTQEAEYLREAVREMPGHGDLMGRSDGMLAVFEAIKKVAGTDSTVLITGETGTGKELVARSLHQASRRADKALVTVNCAAIPANLIESELFGHERGAFTGAVSRREGRFSLADKGTLFLDEVGELPLELQPKLLRVLQEGEFEPLGSTKTVKVDVRVIAATHRHLKDMTQRGSFREDLYFRLNVFPIHIPPLRDRARDVELLAAALVQRFSRRMGKRIGPLTDQDLRALRAYDWPGNVRELQNVIERAVILASDGQIRLDRVMCGFAGSAPSPEEPAQTTKGTLILTAKEMEQLERANIVRALESSGWTVSGEKGAARLLGIPPTTLSSRMKALRIRRLASTDSE